MRLRFEYRKKIKKISKYKAEKINVKEIKIFKIRCQTISKCFIGVFRSFSGNKIIEMLMNFWAFPSKMVCVLCSEGTGTRNTREPTHIWLFYAELELTNPSRVDILPEPYPTNLVPVPSLIAATHQRCKDFFPWKPSPNYFCPFLTFKIILVLDAVQ